MRRAIVLALAMAACGADQRAASDAGDTAEPDPLRVTMTPAPGSLDDLHERIIAKRCSGQPGLCHNGQFEPNLSTPALTYAYLVNRPSLEMPTKLRVAPGNAAGSVFIDKLRGRNGVATQMPLGAEPLPESDLQELEAWIDHGALRAPGAAPAPVMNNPPKRPQIGIFSTSGTRLDGTGPISVATGTTLVLRHTAQDFETPDASIPFSAIVLQVAGGLDIVVDPSSQSPQVGPTAYDASGPLAQGDTFNFKRSWTIPATLSLRNNDTGAITSAPAAGQTVSVIAVYIDGLPAQGGIIALDVGMSPINIQ
jgi:hypothetical protein